MPTKSQGARRRASSIFDICLSYSRADLELAGRLVSALEAQGWTVWWDRTIPPGKLWNEMIQGAVDTARCIVVLWSEKSVRSEWVFAEASEGSARDVLIPVRIDECRIPLPFRQRQTLDLTGWDGRQTGPPFQELVAGIADILDPQPRDPTGSLFDLNSDAWVRLASGSFEMGSEAGMDDERPVHSVELSEFLMARYPVTSADYAAYVGGTPGGAAEVWEPGELLVGKEHHPVVGVSWDEACAFCDWVQLRITAGGHEGRARLPSEAQWEYAARGAEGRPYPWGDDRPTAEHANFGAPERGTTHVGTYRKGATPDGIYDLAGNVWEWCGDWYGPYPDGRQIDPRGPVSGEDRVMRGGSFHHPASQLESTRRGGFPPENRRARVGFRLVWVPARSDDSRTP